MVKYPIYHGNTDSTIDSNQKKLEHIQEEVLVQILNLDLGFKQEKRNITLDDHSISSIRRHRRIARP